MKSDVFEIVSQFLQEILIAWLKTVESLKYWFKHRRMFKMVWRKPIDFVLAINPSFGSL